MQGTPCTYRISVKAIIKDEHGNVLLGREQNGNWELPGGGLEHGESAREGLIREIAEETGFVVDWMSESPVAFWSIHKDVDVPALQWFAFIAYEVRVSGDFRPSADTNDAAQEIRYVSRLEAKTLQLHDNTKPYFFQN